jgi:hypothetical protein
MADNFATFQTGLGDPLTDGVAVTPSDSTVLTTTRAVFVGGAGNISVVTSAGTTLTLTGVTAGTLLPIRVTKVRSTSTTATNIAALW